MSRVPLNLSDGDGLFFDQNGDIILQARGSLLERWTKVTGAESGDQAITGALAVTGAVTAPSATLTGDLNAANLKRAAVTLTNAQIKALADTPVQLAAAPAAGFYHEFVSARLELNAGTNVLTETADNMQIRYGNEAGAAASAVIECTGFIDQAVDTVMPATPVAAAAAATSALAAKALVLCNMDDNFAGNAAADATLKVTTDYRTHAIV